jgi:hypothetical protein
LVPAEKRTWTQAFGRTGDQGNALTAPLSPSNTYVAYLSRLEPLDSGDVTAMFEMVTLEWASNAANSAQEVIAAAPDGPATMWSIAAVAPSTFQAALGVTDPDLVAEGVWFLLTFTMVSSLLEDPAGGELAGDLTDALYPFAPTSTSYGTYELTQGQCLFAPDVQDDGTARLSEPDPASFRAFLTLTDAEKKLLRQLLQGYGALVAALAQPGTMPPPPPPLPPPIGPGPTVVAIGVMDIGAGSCNLLFTKNSAGQLEPLVYLDVGRPYNAFKNTEPGNLDADPKKTNSGPILQNASGTLSVVLTHWDQDHLLLGLTPGLATLPWLAPTQSYGPGTTKLVAGLTRITRLPTGFGSRDFGSYKLVEVSLGRPKKKGKDPEFQNNSGLAMLVPLWFPTDELQPHQCLLPGDASIGNLGGPPLTDVTAYTAVHHGANTFKATENLPTPVVTPGVVAFSYGIRTSPKPTANNQHGYNHPTQASIAANRTAGWTRQVATAETKVVNGAMPEQNGVRGNLLIGQPLDVAPAYATTAFAVYVTKLTSGQS